MTSELRAPLLEFRCAHDVVEASREASEEAVRVVARGARIGPEGVWDALACGGGEGEPERKSVPSRQAEPSIAGGSVSRAAGGPDCICWMEQDAMGQPVRGLMGYWGKASLPTPRERKKVRCPLV